MKQRKLKPLYEWGRERLFLERTAIRQLRDTDPEFPPIYYVSERNPCIDEDEGAAYIEKRISKFATKSARK
jgi:hypothetical protein